MSSAEPSPEFRESGAPAIAPAEARYIGGFGAAAWVPGSELVGS